MGKFKRYDGYVMHVPQEFINSKLPVCPFCKSDNPHWLLDSRMEMSLAGSRTYYQCERCHATMSSTAADAAAEKGKGFGINPAMAAMNAAHKGTKRQEVGVAYMRIEDLGEVCTDTSMLNQEFPITHLQAMVAPATTVCANCGKELVGNPTFCGACGAKQEPAPAPAPVAEPVPAPIVEPVPVPAPAPVAAPAPVVEPAPAPVVEPAPAPAKRFCGQCGKELIGTPAFCNGCGAKQTYAPAPAAAPKAPANAVSGYKFPLVPMILMGIAALGALIGFFGSFRNFGAFLVNFLNLAPFGLAIVGLITCKKEKNTLFGVAFLAFAGISFISMIVSAVNLARYGFMPGYILGSVLGNLMVIAFEVLTGVSYLTAGKKVLKTICAFAAMGFGFISMIFSIAAYPYASNSVTAVLNYMFFTVSMWLAVFLYTPFKKD